MKRRLISCLPRAVASMATTTMYDLEHFTEFEVADDYTPSALLELKCTNCSAGLKYTVGENHLKCDHCEREFLVV